MAIINKPILPGSEPVLEKARHIKYWARCLKTYLPSQYTSNDSNRMYLAFLIVSAADLLDCLTTISTENERQDYINWVYHCQHPNGGFRMWPGTNFDARANLTNVRWDPANVPATYFALAILLIMGDDLQRVNRAATLSWIGKMQREDGSFGETLMNDKIEGGQDPRFAYCATGVRYILRGPSVGPLTMDGVVVQDIDIDGLTRCIRAAESYDGGIADAPYHEPHAGYTFCSLGALAFTVRLNTNGAHQKKVSAPSDVNATLSWLVSRQTALIDPDGEFDTELAVSVDRGTKPPKQDFSMEPVHQSPDKSEVLSFVEPEVQCAGMNGRMNKVADTCYGFWVGASLHVLGQPSLYDQKALQKYLLEKTQHPILGGFGKFPGDLPDIYHSYLGLAALSLADGGQVKTLDGGMCLSRSARDRLPLMWKQWE